MKIFTAQQIHACDKFTIKNEPISSLDLMERAATVCAEWCNFHFRKNEIFYVFCGTGNNGGDGFALARLLAEQGRTVQIFTGTHTKAFSEDALLNLKKAKRIPAIKILKFTDLKNFAFKEDSVIIDALFGTGLNRPVQGIIAEVITQINDLQIPKIAIDIPSGLFADRIIAEDAVIFKADATLSFQFWKKSFLHPETGRFCGKIFVLNIDLSADFIRKEPTTNFIIDKHLVLEVYSPRNDFSHKGTFGTATIVGGAYGKIGAAVLATKAAMKAGSGLTFVAAPDCGYAILQSTCPEAMFISAGENTITKIADDHKSVFGIGCGIGRTKSTQEALLKFLENYKKPLVLDADALNILSENKEKLHLVPKNSIITPHPKEFERLFGKTENSFAQVELARKKAREFQIFIVLKGHHTQVITPDEDVFYNVTGNSGMAKGGSGDALLGIITALLAQAYSPRDAAIFGVWLHGKAGDFTAERFSKEAMLAGDLIGELGNVFHLLAQKIPFAR